MNSKEELQFIKHQLISDIENEETDDDWDETDKEFDINWWKERFQLIEKDLKVLEIIKKHRPVFFRLSFCDTASHYNKIYEDGTCPKNMNYKILSEEEFKLLKEWFEND